jgi:hypothetical protein
VIRRRKGRALGAALAGVALMASAGCATSLDGLEFHNDNRLTISSPHENAKVVVPFTLHWTMSDFTVVAAGQGPVASDTGYFAIFVDRSPVKAGQTLNAVNKNTPSCKDTALCTTKSYLAREQVYTTTKDQLRLGSVADIVGNNESTQYHTATVVLMDTAGRRISESAWSVEFRMRASGVDD